MHSVVIKATGSTAIDIFVSQVPGVCVRGKCSCAIVRAGMAVTGSLDRPVLDRVLPRASSCQRLMAPPLPLVSPTMLASWTLLCSKCC